MRGFSMIAWGSMENPFPHVVTTLANSIGEKVMDTYVPAVTLSVVKEGKEGVVTELFDTILGDSPLYEHYKEEVGFETAVESEYTYEMIVSAEALDETYIDENGNLVSSGDVVNSEDESEENIDSADGAEGGSSSDSEQSEESSETTDLAENEESESSDETEAAETINQTAQTVTGVEYSLETLSSFDFLISQFFTVESNTKVTSDTLNASTFLEKDLTLQKDSSVPQILIFHTHSQEAFSDSAEGDSNTSVVGVGAYLAEVLTNTYGYNVIHHTTVYDLIDGKLDRNYAYTLAEPDIAQILTENPSIQVVLDIHRDGVNEGTHLVTDVNGKQTAQFMFVNGLSYTNTVGDIDYLYNPYISDNLAFSFRMQLMAEKYYPGVTRKILLKGYRYNLHLMPKMAVVEVGAQTNTFEEAKNAMDPLADIIDKVLSGAE